MKKLKALLFFHLFVLNIYAQIGGEGTYNFLNNTSSAKVAAMGGKLISKVDDDLSLTYHNPSLLNSNMDRHLSLNFVNYYAGSNFGYASFAHSITNQDNTAIGLQYINYGSFIAADALGNITGSFTAGEYALNLVFSHKLDSSFTLGGDIRGIMSILENYKSYGISTDWGITYNNKKDLFTLALVLRNLGSQIKAYTPGTFEKLLFEIQLGVTKKLRYAPFSFSMTVQNLEKPNMALPDSLTNNNVESGLSSAKKGGIEKISDQVMRHLIFGVEFTPLSSFAIRCGYNYQRRQEMKNIANPGFVGFSWGLGLTIANFQLNYSRERFHTFGAANIFSISTDLSGRKRKKS